MKLEPKERLILALDVPDVQQALMLTLRLENHVGIIKVGPVLQLLDLAAFLDDSHRGFKFFWDPKLHDVPPTVAGGIRSAIRMEAHMVTLHTCGGQAMLRAAVEVAQASLIRPLLLGITALTSMDDHDLVETGQIGPMLDLVKRRADLAQRCGLNGVVCSGHEVAVLRAQCGPDFLLVVPGVRPAGADHGTQKRVVTPAAAIAGGADYIVVGKPILEAEDSVAMADEIVRQIAAAV